MQTEVAIDGTKFLINGRPTYEGVSYKGRSIEGLLFNSRMIQAVFDDECAETCTLWQYPDTGVWDPDRNTAEFCACLPEYRSYGLLGVTVGLQGGGSVYTPEVYDRYINPAYRPDGSLKEAYFNRLARMLNAADEVGIVVIVNYFYVKQASRIPSDDTLYDIAERVTEWLLRTGHCNILVDVANEAASWWNRPPFHPDNIYKMIDIVKSTTVDGRRLPAGASSGGGDELPTGIWLDTEDFSMPHGNGCTPEQLKAKLRLLKDTDEYTARPRPILINEDSVFIENLEAAVEEGPSWGFYCQDYGSEYKDRMDWTEYGRELDFDALSGYQTMPVNWGINTPVKRAFFERVRTITGGME